MNSFIHMGEKLETEEVRTSRVSCSAPIYLYITTWTDLPSVSISHRKLRSEG